MNILVPLQKTNVAQPNVRRQGIMRSGPQSLGSLDLRSIIGILSRQWRLIISILLLILLLAAALLSQLHSRYTAEALISIDERESQLAGVNDTIASGVTLNNRVDTEVEIMGSTSVALGVIDRLALWRDEEFGFTSISRIDRLKSLVGITLPSDSAPSAFRLNELTPDLQSQLVKKLGNQVSVERRGLTSIISVQATSKDPAKSAEIANAIADSYLEVQTTAKSKTAQRAADFLNTRVNELAKSIQDVDGKIENFIVSQADSIGTPEARAELTRMRDEIKLLSSSQDTLSLQITQLNGIQLNPSSLGSAASLSAELRELAERRSALANLEAAKAPQDLAQQLKAIDQKLRETALAQTATLKDQLSKSEVKKDEVRKQLQELFNRQQIPTDVAVNLYRLQKDAESSRKLYDDYSSRLGEVQQQVGMALPSSQIVAPAIVPHDPSFPPSWRILALASFLGLGLGAAAAFAREHLVGGFASLEQLESVMGMASLATVPSFIEKSPQDAIISSPFSVYSESIRRLRINVENSSEGQDGNVLLVTSTEPNEGKSTLALSLARAFAMSGRKTIIIDGDLRHPSVAKLSGTESKKDLISVLYEVGQKGKILESAVSSEESGLFFLTATPTQKQASDVFFASTQFNTLMQQMRNSYEYIIIDSPPVGYVVDAKIISRSANMVIYVVKQNSTSQRSAIEGLHQMKGDDDKLSMGLVFNNVKTLLGRNYYGYGKYNNYYKN